MTSLNIYCVTCGGHWGIFERDDYTDEKYATCPYCGKTINKETWNKYVLPAFGCTADANRELVKDALNVGERGFSIDVRNRINANEDGRNYRRMRTYYHEADLEK